MLALATLAGCAISRVYVGTPIAADATGAIESGVTTMADVLDRLGAPNQILRGPGGEVFVYRFLRRNSETLTIEEPVITNFEIFSYSRVREKEDRLVVLFDERGVVRSHGLLLGTAEFDGGERN